MALPPVGAHTAPAELALSWRRCSRVPHGGGGEVTYTTVGLYILFTLSSINTHVYLHVLTHVCKHMCVRLPIIRGYSPPQRIFAAPSNGCSSMPRHLV